MQFRVLGSGSRGNASLLWAGDRLLLVDAGLTIRSLNERLDEARVGFRGIDHVVVTHGHLDHARSAGIVAKRHGAVLHCADTIRQHRALSRAPEHASLTAGEPHRIDGGGSGEITIDALRVPHDCDPTFALRFESDGRALALVTDMGEPRDDVAKAFTDAHVVVVEANHDPGMLARGPYPDALKARVAGPGGHLSNEQMGSMLERLAGPRTHTVVLAHLSAKNNLPGLAVEAAERALLRAGRTGVRIVVATQDTPTETIDA